MTKPTLPPDFSPEIQVVNDRIMTTSLAVSNVFGKQHLHVLRTIRELDAPKDFTESNFGLSEYTDSTGRKLPMYLITRDGFTILAMGFTGKRAMEFKIRYIEAFNRMEEELRRRQVQSPETKETLPDVDLERERLRLEAMRIRMDRAMKLKRMILDFREREIFGLAEARRAALSAVEILVEEEPSATRTAVLDCEDPVLLAALRRAVCDGLLASGAVLPGDPVFDSLLLGRGIPPTSRNLSICLRIERAVLDIHHGIRDRILEEELRDPPFRETLEKAVRQFLEGEKE